MKVFISMGAALAALVTSHADETVTQPAAAVSQFGEDERPEVLSQVSDASTSYFLDRPYEQYLHDAVTFTTTCAPPQLTQQSQQSTQNYSYPLPPQNYPYPLPPDYYPQPQPPQYYPQFQPPQYYPQPRPPQYYPQPQLPQYYPQPQLPQYYPQPLSPQYYPQLETPQAGSYTPEDKSQPEPLNQSHDTQPAEIPGPKPATNTSPEPIQDPPSPLSDMEGAPHDNETKLGAPTTTTTTTTTAAISKVNSTTTLTAELAVEPESTELAADN